MSTSILSKTGIRNCSFCRNDLSPAIEICKLDQGDGEEIVFRRNEIAFMLKGKMRFAFSNHPEKELREGEFIFVPMGDAFRYAVLKKAQIVILRLNDSVKLCEGDFFEELYKRGGEASENARKEISSLPINRPLRFFLEGLNENIREGLNCRYYFDTKSRELFILLKAYYPREELINFFSSVLSPDTAFSEYVRANYHRYKTAKELAGSMHIAPRQFLKKFIKVFGEPSANWMKRKKAMSVYSELYAGDDPIALIADRYGFSSQSHLNKFCKREFGMNPGEIRKKFNAKVEGTK